MPKPSRIEPVHIRAADWLRAQDPPRGAQEGFHFGTQCVVIRYSTDMVGEGPRLHVHPYDEIFHVLEGRAEFTVGERRFEAGPGDLVIGPANVPHAYVNLGPGRLDSVDFHLSDRWIQYDLPRQSS
ncbi:MAG: cupin domain-containing protein [Acidobacteria bacterium]|nr:MAG: cupin domain-containing protein [Acidobacteriota bacterium]REK08379.1 MAG: cupin domain-containing protein [Acidobacteriota bacterium]